jgi:tetratricopeptide (TPR) repeat protein
MIKKDCFDSDLKKAHDYLLEQKFTEAIDLFSKLEIEKPNNQEIKLFLGTALVKCERYNEAIVVLKNGINISDSQINIHYALGVSYFALQDYPMALREFANEIKLNPTNPIPYCESAYALYELKEYEGAINFLEKSIKLDPNYADAYHCMGATLNNAQQPQDALPFALKAIEIDSSRAEYYFDAANIFFTMRRKNEAIGFYEKAIKINASYREALYNKGLVHLTYMEFELGWQLYELRPSLTEVIKKNQLINLDASLIGNAENILILKEQGIGDQILYSSFFPELKQGKDIHIEIDQRLLPVYTRSFKGLKFQNKINTSNLLDYDFILPMGSLGLALKKNNINSMRRSNQFLFSDQEKTKQIRTKILGKGNSSKICGLSWKSYNDAIGENKSVNLESLFELLKTPDIFFVSLQYGIDKNDVLNFCQNYGIKILLLDDIDLYNDIDSLFSLIDACDLIISVSNINAHIAGALGKKTYLLAPYSTGRHWYWHAGSNQSLWYPSIDIFSQTETGDWSLPINEIKEKIIG